MKKPAAQGSAATAQQSVPFNQMSGKQKALFVLKLAVTILTFGFIFPNVMND